MMLTEQLCRVAERHGGKLALRAPDAELTYAQLVERADALAADLAARGIEPGDRIAYLGFNSAAQLVLVFACARLGAIAVPLNWRLAAPELAWMLADVAPKLLVADAAHRRVAEALIPSERLLEAVALLTCSGSQEPTIRDGGDVLVMYTSGATGRPKGVIHSQASVMGNARLSWDMHDMTADDHVLTVLPMFHVGGLNIQTLPALLCGATVTLMDRFDPAACLAATRAHRPTLSVQVPATFEALFAQPDWDGADLSSYRCISTGSTDVPVEIIERLHGRGVPVIQIYGTTETGPVVIYQKAEDARSTVGSIGRAGPDVTVHLNDDGEIWLKSPSLARGFWPDTPLLEDGWFKSGDIARVDDGGVYWFADRKKNLIISGGENITPTEIERVLRPLPGVTELAVVGVPDSRWGEVPVVVYAGGADEGALRAATGAQLARFKQPKRYLQVAALPRNAMGKVVPDAVKALLK